MASEFELPTRMSLRKIKAEDAEDIVRVYCSITVLYPTEQAAVRLILLFWPKQFMQLKFTKAISKSVLTCNTYTFFYVPNQISSFAR